MNSKNSKTSACQTLLVNLSDKINLKRCDKYIAIPNLSIDYPEKNIKNSNRNNKFKK